METPLNSVRYYLSILCSKVYSDWTQIFVCWFVYYILAPYEITNYKHTQQTDPSIYLNIPIAPQALPSATKTSHNGHLPPPSPALDAGETRRWCCSWYTVYPNNTLAHGITPLFYWNMPLTDLLLYLITKSLTVSQSRTITPSQWLSSDSEGAGNALNHSVSFLVAFRVSHPRTDTVQPVKLMRADKITAQEQ